MNAATALNLQKTLQKLRANSFPECRIGLVLGSGLGDLADGLDSPRPIDTRTLPGYPHSSIEGHRGRIVFGFHAGIPVVAFQGRVHFYETGDIETPLFPIHVAHGLGVKILFITNAAGGINPSYAAGDLMLISDQMNLTGEAISGNAVESNRSNTLFDEELIRLAEAVSREKRIRLWKGIYAGVKGPSYETAAEVRMIGRLGGDAVGMSTVLESSLAVSLGMRLVGISCITNKATGISDNPLSHAEVKEAAASARRAFASLVLGMVERIGPTAPQS